MAVTIHTEAADDGIGRAILLTCVECNSEYVRVRTANFVQTLWACPSCEDVD